MAQSYDVCFAAPADTSKAIRKVVVLSPHVTIEFMKPGTRRPSEGTAEKVKADFQSVLSQKFEEQGFKPLLDGGEK